MSTIGYVTYDEASNSYSGILQTLAIKEKITMLPVRNKSNDRAPDFRIFAENKAEIGGAWNKTSQAGNDYVSITVDDPGFPAPLYANLGVAANQDDPNVFALIWNRVGT